MSGGGNLAAPFKGFTLAEVLVTLGIIGVVSAMTVPTLMQNYQRKSYVTQLHKVYNEVQQALLQYQTDRNAVDLKEAGLVGADAQIAFVKKYFKVVQDCGENLTPCFSNSYKKLAGTTATVSDADNYFVLANGSAIATTSKTTINSNNLVMEVWVDVNGQQGPNIIGRDHFIMYIYKNGVIDDINWEEQSSGGNTVFNVPLEHDYRERMFTSHCLASENSRRGCFGKILNDNWEMTY